MDEEIPKNILERADKANENLLPRKSRLQYDKEYHNFEKWMLKNNLQFTNVSETALMGYFQELSESFSPNSLWSKFSMLRSTLLVYTKINIKNYSRLEKFLKQLSKGYLPKKSKILTQEDVLKFMKEAPENIFLLEKVIMVMGIFGGLRRDELMKLNVDDIDDRGAVVVVTIQDTKTGGPKSSFTGHCLRRTSATLLVNAGGDMLTLKRHGQWKSDTVASGYIKESMASKNKISRLIGTGNGEAGTSRDTGMSGENGIVFKTDASNLNVSSVQHSLDLGNCSISGSTFTNCTFNFK